MHQLLRLLLALSLAVSVAVAASAPKRDLGTYDVNVNYNKVTVRVSATTPDLDALARRAFSVHGRYAVVNGSALDITDRTGTTTMRSSYQYDIKFTPVTVNTVRVDITKGASGTSFATATATGTDARNALLRAADFAVEKTNGLGLRGFFTAKLAFIVDQGRVKEVNTSDLFFTAWRRITSDRALALSPRWSPDGSMILYTSFFKSGFPDIFEINLGSLQRTIFAQYRGANSGARFSPTGAQVAMTLSGTGTREIYIADAAGHHPVRRTFSDTTNKSAPCWSPNGAQIAFEMEPGPQLYVMSASGGTPRRLFSGYTYAAEPDWNPVDPNKIACTVRTSAGQFQIAVIDVARGEAKVVSHAGFDGIEPSWLADGRHLVYTARDPATSVLSILDTESGESNPISPRSIGAVVQASVWTPPAGR